jgi:soluble lytic murein transglycosylase-like protein
MQMATLPYIDNISQDSDIPVVEAAEYAPEVATTEAPAPAPIHGPEVESYVREYFSDVPVLAEIARCESTFRHHDIQTGTILRGRVNSNDIGVMQINTTYHRDTAQRLGYDLTTIDGNLGYARNLYEREGTRPWNSSRSCWQNGHLAMR